MRRRLEDDRLLGDQLVSEQVHQEPVMPGAVKTALVTAHDPDRAKTHFRVAPDGCGVVGGGIDDQAVVAAVSDQVSPERTNRAGAESAAVKRRVQVDVTACVPVIALILPPPLEPAPDAPLVPPAQT